MLSARSASECDLYVELHPCGCGAMDGSFSQRLESRAAGLVTVYEGRCQGCGKARSFEFALDSDITPLGKFGGATPSRIIDAGQYLMTAEIAARKVPAEMSTISPPDRHEACAQLQRAIAALEEVLKFIPPGSDCVPCDALFTKNGRALYAAEPGRFRKTRIQAVLDVYREAERKFRG